MYMMVCQYPLYTRRISHIETGRGRGGYREDTKPYLLVYTNHIADIHTYAGYKGLRLNGLIKNKLNMVFLFLNVSP